VSARATLSCSSMIVPFTHMIRRSLWALLSPTLSVCYTTFLCDCSKHLAGYIFIIIIIIITKTYKVKVRQAWICIAPRHEHTSKVLRYGTHSQGISQFYLHTPRTSTNGMNHTCLCLPSRSWYSFTHFIIRHPLQGLSGAIQSNVDNYIQKN